MKAMAGDAEYQPVAAGRVPLPDGQEAVAKRQGFRQVRWAAASLCLLLIAVVGSRSAMRHSTDEEKGTATMPASAASAAQPAKMMTLAEIQAHAAAHVHLAHKAANVPAGGKKLHKIDAAALADQAQPNSKLVKLLRKKAAVYEKAGSAQLASAHKTQHAAEAEKVAAAADIARANKMKKEANEVKQQGMEAKESFAQAEEPTLHADKALKAADKAYRHDMLEMAMLYPQVGEDKSEHKPVPAALADKLKNLTAHLKSDEALKKRDGEMLASAASASTNSFNEQVGTSPENLQDQSTVYGLSMDEKATIAKAQHTLQLAQAKMSKGKQAEVVAKRVLGVATCINKHADRYFYDENKEAHVEHAYQRILDDCNA